jgi:hypothetical protein
VETVVHVLLGLSGLLTLACWVSLWRGRDGLGAKIAWTLLSAVPLLGPLLYGGVHDPPSVQEEVDRARAPSTSEIPPPHDPP